MKNEVMNQMQGQGMMGGTGYPGVINVLIIVILALVIILLIKTILMKK